MVIAVTVQAFVLLDTFRVNFVQPFVILRIVITHSLFYFSFFRLFVFSFSSFKTEISESFSKEVARVKNFRFADVRM
jgi:hypothetical protein